MIGQRVRGEDAQPAGELQRGQVHRFRHVHDVRHLGRFRAHLLWQRVENHHALHLRLSQRHGNLLPAAAAFPPSISALHSNFFFICFHFNISSHCH